MTDEKRQNHWVPSIEELESYLVKILHNIGGTIMHEEGLASDELKVAKAHFEIGVSSIVALIRKQTPEVSPASAAEAIPVVVPVSEEPKQ